MSVKKSIKDYCRDFCMQGQGQMVPACGEDDCALWHHRIMPSVKGYVLSPLKSVKAKCKDCTGEGLVKDCKFTMCQLFIYREGHNPVLIGTRPGEQTRLKKKHTF